MRRSKKRKRSLDEAPGDKGKSMKEQDRKNAVHVKDNLEAAKLEIASRSRIRSELNGLEIEFGGGCPGSVRFLTAEAQALVSRACAVLFASPPAMAFLAHEQAYCRAHPSLRRLPGRFAYAGYHFRPQ